MREKLDSMESGERGEYIRKALEWYSEYGEKLADIYSKVQQIADIRSKVQQIVEAIAGEGTEISMKKEKNKEKEVEENQIDDYFAEGILDIINNTTFKK